MTAERGTAAVLHGRHDLELAETEVAALLVCAMRARGRGRYPRPPGVPRVRVYVG